MNIETEMKTIGNCEKKVKRSKTVKSAEKGTSEGTKIRTQRKGKTRKERQKARNGVESEEKEISE